MQQHQSTLEDKAYYRADIDGLRGVAVILVILYHLFPRVFRNGFLGVDFFFVISGFVVVQALERNLSRGWWSGLAEFYGRRAKRILPALYLTTLVTITLSCLLIPPTDLRSIFKTAGAAVLASSNIALLYARFDYFSPDLSLNPFVHTWSLGVEEQFYFVFPTVLLFAMYLTAASRRVKVGHPLILLAGSSFAYWVYLQYTAPVSAFYNPLARFWELFIGATLHLNRSVVASRVGPRASVLVQGLAVAFLAVALLSSPEWVVLDRVKTLFVVLSATLAIAAGLTTPAALNRVLQSNLLVWNGKLSYSLYLWHYAIFSLARWIVDVERPLYAFGALLLTYAMSIVSFQYVESHFRYATVRGLKALFRGLTAGAVSFAYIGALYLLPPTRLFLGNASHYANLWPPDGSLMTASLKIRQRDCHLEYRDRLSPELMDRCATVRGTQRFIFLLGNSHAQHLIPMLDEVARSRGYGYSALTISNCRLVDAVQVISEVGYRYELCRDYFEYSRAYITSHARPDDIVLVGARSLLDKPSPLDMHVPSGAVLGSRSLTVGEVYEESRAEWTAFLGVLRARGVSVVFVGPTPQFSLPATQCSSEWFRGTREGCRVAAHSVVAANKRYIEAVSEVVGKSGNGYLWSPLDVLCDSVYCYPSRNNTLVYRDTDHLSIYGSASLAPSFLAFMSRIERPALLERYN